MGVPLEMSNYFRSSSTEQYKFGKRLSRRQRHCVAETSLVSLTLAVAPCRLFLTHSTPDAATSSSLLCGVWPERSTAGVLFLHLMNKRMCVHKKCRRGGERCECSGS